MSALFVDTAGWGHLVDPTQEFHRQAADLYRQTRRQGRRFVTTNYILTELVALLTSPVRHVNEMLDAQAWRLLAERPDKEWSLVDCASFVLMREAGLVEALTTDHHFEQAGFVRLLKP